MEEWTREQFLIKVDEVLAAHQFQKDGDVWVCTQYNEQPGATININGQVIQQPGQTLVNKFVITDLGEGWISNPDDTNKIPWEQFRFEIFQNENPMMIIEECFYFNEADEIMNIFLNRSEQNRG